MDTSGSQQSAQCPVCLRGFLIPAGGTATLLQNLHLGFEVEVAGYVSKVTSSLGVSCNFCRNGCTDSAVAFCCSCRQFLCRGARDSHNRVPQLTHHCTIGLDIESASKLPTLMESTPPDCSQCNQANAVTCFYCQTCSLPICPLCTIAYHKEHSITGLSAVAEAHRGEMKKALQHAQEFAPTLAKAIDSNCTMMLQVENSKHDTELAIEKVFKELSEIMEERKKVLLLELETISLPLTTSLTAQKEQLKKIEEDIGCYIAATSHVLQTHADHEVVALGHLLPTELESILKIADSIPLSPSQRCYLAASTQMDSLVNEVQKLGKIVNLCPAPHESTYVLPSIARVNVKFCVKVETKTQLGEKYPRGGLQVDAELLSQDGPVVVGQVEDHGDGTYTVTLTPHTAGLHQLCITMDGQHIRKSPCDLVVRCAYTTLFSAQQVINVDAKPLCVAIHQGGDIYVGSLDDRIYVFDQSGSLKNTIGGSGKGSGQFKCPSSISIAGDVMHVADFSNHRVQTLTTRGDFLHAFGEKGSGPGQFSGPRNVIIDSEGRLIVLDKGNNRVQIFKQSGDWILTVDGNDSGNVVFRDPWGLALDSQGHIHVTAWNSNTIKVFTLEGKHVRSYGTVEGPRGVVVDDDGYSFVSEFNESCLTVFDPQGNRIHMVRNLNKPYGAVIHNSGTLYVPNFGGSSVMKYSM